MSDSAHSLNHEEHHCVTLVPLFNALSPAEIAQVEQIVRHRTFEKGETVISPFNDPQLTIVAQGALKIYQLSLNGKEQLLRVIGPGEYAGEEALFGAVNENLYGETISKSTICYLKQTDFRKLLLDYPKLSLRLLEINAQKSMQTQQQTNFLMMDDIESRLANYLLQLATVAGSDQVELPMKMKDLAAFIGTTPETLSRKFKLLEEDGYITRQGRNIKLLDKDGLEDDYA